MTDETKSQNTEIETSSQEMSEEQIWYQNVYKGNKINEFTPKVLFVGMFLAAVMVAMNVYMGLKIGWGVGG
jgi:hypothetical protein